MPLIHLKTPTASYTITIASGILPTLFPRLRKLNKKKKFRPFVITSPNIWALWSKPFLASFPEPPTVLFIKPGEANKRLSTVERLADQLAEAGADRDSLLFAFGGGVIGDITGFLAAIFMRGIPYVQLPTTLLAQVDSSIGGKTGANLRAGKNLIGAFHHPLAVYVDTGLLNTLPANELRAGLQESIKAGIIRDPKLFRFLETHRDRVLSLDNAAVTRVIADSIRVKADVVTADERESGLRMILNFGHTLGHAIEAVTKYRQLLHGEAVAWGSIAATQLALNRGRISTTVADRIHNVILSYGPLPHFHAQPKQLVALTHHDKKARSGTRSFILPTSIGTCEIVQDVTDPELLSAADGMFHTMHRQTSDSKPFTR